MRINVVQISTRDRHQYSDLNLFLGSSDKKLLSTDIESINQNIMMILDTPKQSKWWRPRIGSNLSRYLFEPMDDLTATKIKTEITQILEANGEFRVKLNYVDVVPDYDNEQYYVEIGYNSATLNQNNISFAFNMARAA
jgi:phage baseplate assembly protein W